MNKLSIRALIGGGFALILVILAIIAAEALIAHTGIQATVNTVVRINQPAVVQSMELSRRLERTVASLGLYMLSHEESYKRAFQSGLESLQEGLHALHALPAISDDLESKRLMEGVETAVEELTTYEQRMIELVDDPSKNLPAVTMASRKINPLRRKVEQLLARAQLNAHADGVVVDPAVLENLQTLNIAWDNTTSGMGAFLLYRSENAKNELTASIKLVKDSLGLLSNSEQSMPADLAKTLSQARKFIDRTLTRIDDVVTLHGSEQWRADAELIRTEFGPKLQVISDGLKSLIEVQRTRIAQSSDLLATELRDSRTLLIVLLVAGLLVGTGIAVVVVRRVVALMVELRTAFDHLANGDFSYRMDDSSKGEVALIVQSLESMKLQLRESIERDALVAAENARIRQALDSVSAMALLVDSEGIVVYMNNAMRDWYESIRSDRSSSDLIGSDLQSAFAVAQLSSTHVLAIESRYEAEFEVDGRDVFCVANAVFSQNGDRLGTVIEWEDRTAEVVVEREIAELIEKAHSGDLDVRLNVQGMQGFFRILGDGMNRLLLEISHTFTDIASVMGALAEGRLTSEIKGEYTGVIAQTRDDINRTIAKLNSIVGQIRASSEVTISSSTEISAGNNDLSRRSEQQATNLETAARSIEELTAAVGETAASAQRANKLAEEAQDSAVQGGDVVNRANHAMTAINDASQKIAEIIGMIDEIAFQTNLLALNASVEAARAGEHGRGFAVVATEVRNLSLRTASSAKEIKSLVDDSTEKVQTGADLVTESGERLQGIVQLVQQLSGAVAEITEASSVQSHSIERVNDIVTSLEELTKDNAQLAVQISSASEMLHQQAAKTTEQLKFFTLLESSGSSTPRKMLG